MLALATPTLSESRPLCYVDSDELETGQSCFVPIWFRNVKPSLFSDDKFHFLVFSRHHHDSVKPQELGVGVRYRRASIVHDECSQQNVEDLG